MSTTFQGVWDEAVARHGSRTFLVFRSEAGVVGEWTYAEFDRSVAAAAGTLRSLGVGAGDAVHLVLRNCPAFLALWLAASRLGAWIVPVDPASAAPEIGTQVRRVAPAVGVCAAARAGTYRQGAGQAVPAVVELAEDATDLAADGPLGAADAVDGPAPVDPATRLAVMFTSGTTSQPKGVVLTQANYVSVARVMSEAADVAPRHRWYVTLPLFHANAQYYCFAPAIRAGASVALTATFSASRWVAHARELAVTHASLFAAPIRMILARTPETEAPLALEHLWFAQSLGAEHYARFTELIGTRPRQLYGMTETVAIVCADTGDPLTHDVIGTPVGGRRVRLEDRADGAEVAPGTPGELVVLGEPGDDLFAGYLDDPATTAAVFRETADGTWFHTGDLARVDEGGRMRFVGRVDDVIKVSGENVSLTEVEAAIAEAPGVLEAAVLAQPDPVRDVVPVAYVVPGDAAAPPDVEELARWAEQHLSPAARPREWHLIDELPRTSVGKIRRFQISTPTGG